MATITANAGPERMNKWLLIGGVALALLTGVLVFAAISGLGGDDGESGGTAVVGGSQVLVARENIAAGTKVDADMFRVATFAEEDLVPQPVSDAQAIVGQTATVEILRGQQLSRSHLTLATDDARAEQLAFKLPEGHRGLALGVSEVSAVGGHIVPGDRVDVVVLIEEDNLNDPNDEIEYIRVRPLFQNVLVVAREEVDVNRVVTLGEGTEATDEEAPADAAVTESDEFQQRPEDVERDAGLSTVVVALTPEQVIEAVAYARLGEVTISLRKFGEDEIVPVQDLRLPVTSN